MAAATGASSLGPVLWDGASAEEQLETGRVVSEITHWEQGTGKDFRVKLDKYYRQYRGFQEFNEAWVKGGVNDRDAYIYEAEKHWGAQLHIPLSFRTIETIVPRAIAHMPKLLIEPRDEQWRKNVEAVRLLIDRQQNQINIDLALQEVMREGGIYGLGVSKVYWRTELRTRRRQERLVLSPSKFGLSEAQREVTFDDPMFEALDVFDVMWDPNGADMRTCEWFCHRLWLSTAAVLQRVQSGTWATASAKTLDEEAIRGLGGDGNKYGEVWKARREAGGYLSWRGDQQGEFPHEVLEFHDGDRVLTVLDRKVLVQDGENPTGEKPFQIYRPTPLPKEFAGIGWLEPLEHLQREIDTLRSQRRDKVTLALNSGFAYNEAAIEPEDLVWGPEKLIPVRNSQPKDAIWPLPVNDVAGSGWEEETAIRTDIEAVSGLTDALDNSPGGQISTATEANLVQAALGRRIELTSRRFEIEIVREAARQFLYLDQRMISTNRAALRVPTEQPGAGVPENDPMDDDVSAWKQYPIGPGELEGEYEIEVEGGSMAARNTPQERQDAMWLWNNAAHDWYLDPTKVRLRALELFGIKHPQSYLRAPTPAVPQVVLRLLLQRGVDPQILMSAVLQAREISAPQEGPAANQITEQMGEGSP